jgi:hypothetical protein
VTGKGAEPIMQQNGFTAEDILNKERQLRGYMTSNTEAELKALLAEAGFGATQEVWRRFPFMAMSPKNRTIIFTE